MLSSEKGYLVRWILLFTMSWFQRKIFNSCFYFVFILQIYSILRLETDFKQTVCLIRKFLEVVLQTDSFSKTFYFYFLFDF